MALAPWGVFVRGAFKSPEEYEKKEEGRKTGGQSENVKKISAALDKLAKDKGTLITGIALAYVVQKSPYVFPIVGGRKIEHVKGNMEALSIELSDEDVDEIESAAPFDHGFRLNFLFEYGDGQKYNTTMGPGDNFFVKSAGGLNTVPKSRKDSLE